MHQKLFFPAPKSCKNSPALGGGHPDPSPARSLRSLANYFRRHGNTVISRGARSLIIKMNLKRHAQSSILSSCPLVFGGNHILVIFAQNMHQKLFFSGSQCKIVPALGGETSSPRPSLARSLCSLAVLLGGLLTRIFDSPPPPEKKCLVTGLCNNAFF